jgi:hypothetical protein
MKNIEKFEFGMTAVLDELYDSFPIPKEVNVRGLDSEFKNDGSVEDQLLLNIYGHTVHFLKSEGYIKTNDKEVDNSIIFRKCVLTSKGLTALHKVPSTLRGEKSLIEQIHDVKSSGLTTASKSVISTLTKAFISA